MSRKRASGCCNVLHVAIIFAFLSVSNCSLGDTSEIFSSCLQSCNRTGCAFEYCIPGCSPTGVDESTGGKVSAPLELRLLQWDCLSECKYQCMRQHVALLHTATPGAQVLKYYGKWPFTRYFGLQELASSLFSVLNFLAALVGLRRFVLLAYFRLPRRVQGDKSVHYEYAGLIVAHGLFVLNSWLWSAIFHARDTKFTEAWDYSSAVALVGLSLLLAILRTCSVTLEATRVMVAAPVIAFTTTHILYLNNFSFDYGWNMIVCTVMGVTQLLLWSSWALISRHPARLTLLLTCIGTALAMLLELYDFPPIWGVFDAHSLWHAASIPLTLLWWDFICHDARVRTAALVSRKGRGSPSSTTKAKKSE